MHTVYIMCPPGVSVSRMLLPSCLLVLLISMPILIESSPQDDGGSRKQVCRISSQCEKNEKCQSGFCVNPCGLLQCGQGAKCQVSQRQGQCVCPAGTTGNPLKQCEIIPECNDDSHCGDGEICRIGSCVNNCAAMQCGVGAKCQINGNNTQCICPANTDGNPTIRCQPIQVCRINLQCKHNEKCESGFCINPCGLLQCGQGAKCQVSQRRGQCVCPTGTEGNPRKQCEPIPECRNNSQCGNNENCQSGVCVDPCVLIKCGQGASCQVSQRLPQCLCPDNTKGDPLVRCQVTQECRNNSQCGNNENCQSGVCVDPCVSIKCGQGASCQVSQRLPQCLCPDNTKGDPLVRCQATQVCNDDSHCGDSETCSLGSCVNKCDAIRCGEGAICQMSGNNPQCICPANTEGNPVNGCQPIQGISSKIAFPDELNQTQSVQDPGQGTRLRGCETKPDPGECRGAFPRYYYNKASDQCDCFLFGGCEVEGVKFTWPTFDECLNNCVPVIKTKGPGCKRASVDEVKEFLEEQRRIRENN